MIHRHLTNSIALLGLGAITLWMGLGRIGITDLDEGLYLAAARGMLLTGDYVTPRVGTEPFFEKPPLLYWLVAASLRWFGQNEAAARLPSAFAASLTALVVFLFGHRYLNQRSAFAAVAFLVIAPVFVASARLATTDALLVLFLTAAMFSLFQSWIAGDRSRWLWTCVAGASMGLGMLAKGAPAVVLPAGTVLLLTFLRRRRQERFASSRERLIGLFVVVLLALVVAAPWHIAAWRANGEGFVEEYVVRQHLGRFQGGDRSHQAPVWFFVPGFLVGFFPGSVFTVAALFKRFPGPTETQSPKTQDALRGEALRFLKIWFWLTFVLFSASGSKLISYILPLYPPAALLAGAWIENAQEAPKSRFLFTSLGTAASLIILTLLAVTVWPDPVLSLTRSYADRPVILTAEHRQLLSTFRPLLLVLLGGSLSAAFFGAVGQIPLAFRAMVSSSGAFLGMVVWMGAPIMQREVIGSVHELAKATGRVIRPSERLILATGSPSRPSAYFYLPGSLLQEKRVEQWEIAKLPDLTGQYPALVITRGDWSPAESSAAWTPLIKNRDYALWRVIAMARDPQ